MPTNQKLDINVYPNPSSDFINIGLDASNLDDSPIVKIYSIAGTLVKEILMDKQAIDISNLESGIYLVVLYKGNGKGVLGIEKLIIE